VHLHVPAVLLSLLYAAAVAVAISHPGADAMAGAIVLAGLVTRRLVRHHRRSSPAAVVRPPEPAPGVAPVASA
jgi:hypothetical protein